MKTDNFIKKELDDFMDFVTDDFGGIPERKIVKVDQKEGKITITQKDAFHRE